MEKMKLFSRTDDRQSQKPANLFHMALEVDELPIYCFEAGTR